MENSNNNSKSKKVQFVEITKELNKMAAIDQEARKREINKPGISYHSIDKKNTKRMKEIIEQIGWPTISKVGKEASLNAWLLVQHADKDVEFQRYCLSIMKQESSDEVTLHDIAYLEDRVRINSGKSQIYGTQFHKIENKVVPREIEDPENVDVRRKKMGLDTIAENTNRIYQTYKIEKPK